MIQFKLRWKMTNLVARVILCEWNYFLLYNKNHERLQSRMGKSEWLNSGREHGRRVCRDELARGAVRARRRAARGVTRAGGACRPRPRARPVRGMRAERAALHAWLVCCAAALSAHKYSTRVVRTKYGPLRGIVVHSHPQVEAYLGVPYATPPLGSLRWAHY